MCDKCLFRSASTLSVPLQLLVHTNRNDGTLFNITLRGFEVCVYIDIDVGIYRYVSTFHCKNI